MKAELVTNRLSEESLYHIERSLATLAERL